MKTAVKQKHKFVVSHHKAIKEHGLEAEPSKKAFKVTDINGVKTALVPKKYLGISISMKSIKKHCLVVSCDRPTTLGTCSNDTEARCEAQTSSEIKNPIRQESNTSRVHIHQESISE